MVTLRHRGGKLKTHEDAERRRKMPLLFVAGEKLIETNSGVEKRQFLPRILIDYDLIMLVTLLN